ncbi:MAG: hypothetical protein QM656_15680 [Paracoccaceae bacterium]
MDIAVIGAGRTGLAAASLPARGRHRHRITVVESFTAPSTRAGWRGRSGWPCRTGGTQAGMPAHSGARVVRRAGHAGCRGATGGFAPLSPVPGVLTRRISGDMIPPPAGV